MSAFWFDGSIVRAKPTVGGLCPPYDGDEVTTNRRPEPLTHQPMGTTP